MTREAASRYLSQTDHERGNLPRRALDWSAQPAPFKIYQELDTVSLPDPALPATRLEDALWHGAAAARVGVDRPWAPRMPLKLQDVSTLLQMAAGVTDVRKTPTGEFHFRAVASAGALYPCELYVALRAVEGIEDGLYHYRPDQHLLHVLRRGDVLPGRLAGHGEAAQDGMESLLPEEGGSDIRFFITGIFARSAWKYGERAYRYVLLDAGHMAENVQLAASAVGMPMRRAFLVRSGGAARLLGVDAQREYPLLMLEPVQGMAGDEPSVPAADLSLQLASCVSGREGRFAALEAMHAAVSDHEDAHRQQREPSVPGQEGRTLSNAGIGAELAGVMEKRRSRRAFMTQQLPLQVLDALARCLCADPDDQAPEVWFSVSRVHDAQPGLYRLDRTGRRLVLLHGGDHAQAVSKAALDQHWLSRCAVQVFFVQDESGCDAATLARGWVRSGMLGQRLYLAATALRLGCCGVGAMYDSEMAEALKLQGRGRVLYALGLGLCGRPKK